MVLFISQCYTHTYTKVYVSNQFTVISWVHTSNHWHKMTQMRYAKFSCKHTRSRAPPNITYLSQEHRPQHLPRSVRFFSASLMSWLIWSSPSSIRSSCSGWRKVGSQSMGVSVVKVWRQDKKHNKHVSARRATHTHKQLNNYGSSSSKRQAKQTYKLKHDWRTLGLWLKKKPLCLLCEQCLHEELHSHLLTKKDKYEATSKQDR